jgi:predicted  nucleic acid-binding Zn-ribbon protein
MQTAETLTDNESPAFDIDGEVVEQAGMSIAALTALLTKCVNLDIEKKALAKDYDRIDEDLKRVKEQIAAAYMQMGVKSMKAANRNIYLSKEVWAGIAEGTSRAELSEALVAASMEDFITCNSKKLTSYLRESIADHKELFDDKGDLTASPEEVLAVLPEPFNKMFKVSEKIDIRIRK